MIEWGVPVESAGEQIGSLGDRFIVPPFSVLDTRQGYWQARRRAWLSLGIQSEVGRGADLLDTGAGSVYNGGASYAGVRGPRASPYTAVSETNYVAGRDALHAPGIATSVFDPVLCELIYRWFCPEGGAILDPFAGGSVRGIVASRLGHPYTGIDLSAGQIEANREQAQRICTEPLPEWIEGDSADVLPTLAGEYDLVFSCPPYYNLEVYSDNPADLSNARNFAEFAGAFGRIIRQAAAHLRDSRFLVLVVSEIRDKDGYCHGLVPTTTMLAELAGLRLYNEAVLLNSVGSLPLRVGLYMEASRKLGRAHQNVLVYVKGEPPRGWSYERAAPPTPQLSLFAEDVA